MGKKKTHDEYIKQVSEINPNIEVIGMYNGYHSKILHRCKIDSCEWFAQPANILNNEGCPMCGRVSTIKKQRHTHKEYVSKLSTLNPNISVIEEYINCNTKILHQCLKCGHIWDISPSSALSGHGCPICAGNSKKTNFDYVKELSVVNPNIGAIDTYINAKTSIMHKCRIDGYEWMAKPLNTLRGKGCPMCSGQIVAPGYNDLATKYPHLTDEWDYTLNTNILPTEVSYGSNISVWWKCGECGKSYKSKISNRVYNNSSCPRCNKKSSVAEIQVYYYIKKYFSDAIHNFHDKEHNITELDVYIPSLNIGIEYDGERWHRDIHRDKIKDNICSNLGIKLFRIREINCPEYDSNCIFIHLNKHSKSDLENVIENILRACGIEKPEVDFKRDHIEIHNLIFRKKIQNSLALMKPDLLCEWDVNKNGNIDPYKIAYKSNARVWWKCQHCGNEWFTTVNSRSSGNGCSKCAIKKRKNKES